jgi:TATA-box binding protein (TBP) (component of TFIID and TFIIIB)
MKIENCSAVFRLFPSNSNRKILHEQYLAIARNGINVEYNPKRFHSLIMRFPIHDESNKCNVVAALIFKSGKVVLTGIPNPGIIHSFKIP